MNLSLNGPDSLLPVAIIIIVIVVIIAAAFFIQRSRKRQLPDQDTGTSTSVTRHSLDYQPVAKPKPVIMSTIKPVPGVRAAEVPKPKDIDLTNRKDLTESLVALSEKYSLDVFTIATADGLVFGSSGGDAAQNDAATYSELFKNNPLVETPGIELFGLTYKGSELIGIIRTKTPLPENNVKLITADTKIILNWWI
jgi:hypothetical protein